jgi:hypothetical protein
VPWQECNLMDERLKFIARLLDGEKMAQLCREFGVSRKPSSGARHRCRRRFRVCRAPAARNADATIQTEYRLACLLERRNSPKIDAFMRSVLQT